MSLISLSLFLICVLSLFPAVKNEYVVSPVRPLYECDPLDKAVLLSDWYANCKSSCSPYKGMTTSQFQLYLDGRVSLGINAYTVHYIRNHVSSHTDLFDNCRILHTTQTYIPKEEEVPDIRNRLLQEAEKNPHNTTLIIESPLLPECSYFSDNAVSYDSLIAMKMVGKLNTETEGAPIINIPALSLSMDLGNGYQQYGDSIIIYNMTKSDIKACKLLFMDTITCINYTESKILDCPHTGMTFSFSTEETKICDIENISASGGGYFLVKGASQRKESEYHSISDSISKLDDPSVAYVISQINIAYGSFVDSACESICDISDQLFSIKRQSSSVMETPIGPWLGWREPVSRLEHLYYVSSCRRVSNWVLKSPLSICPNSTGMSISNQEGGHELWDPVNTYFLISRECSNFPSSDLHQMLVENKTIVLGFWGKELIAEPPYIVNVTWEDSSLHIFRSSKWLPYIHGISANATRDFYVMLQDISTYASEVRKIKRMMSPDGILKTISSWYSSMYSVASEIKEKAVSYFQDITLMIGILLKIIPLMMIVVPVYMTYKLVRLIFKKKDNRVPVDWIETGHRLVSQ